MKHEKIAFDAAICCCLYSPPKATPFSLIGGSAFSKANIALDFIVKNLITTVKIARVVCKLTTRFPNFKQISTAPKIGHMTCRLCKKKRARNTVTVYYVFEYMTIFAEVKVSKVILINTSVVLYLIPPTSCYC